MSTERKCIDDMKPGRELDALVAEKVDTLTPGIPPCSTDISAAWPLVVKFSLCVWPTDKKRFYVFQQPFSDGYGDEYYFGGDRWPDDGHLAKYGTVSDSAPHAIALTSLKAVGYEF